MSPVSRMKQIRTADAIIKSQPSDFYSFLKHGTTPALPLFATLDQGQPTEEGIDAVGTFERSLTCLLLIGCAASATLSLPVQAEGNGIIVLNRDVQPIHIGRNGGKDPYPTTVNANPSDRINQATTSTELSDGEFANVASGSPIRNTLNPNTGVQGLNVVTNPNGMPGMNAGHGGGSGGAISGTINRSLSSGLAPLGRLAGGQ